LDAIHDEIVDELWRDMVADCTVINKHIPPLPHFSWQVFESCNYHQLNAVISEIAENTTPFIVRTSGLGVFTDGTIVIYIALIKDEGLMRFQKMLWEATIDFTQNISPYYNPSSWTPHITLINGVNEDKNVICALDKLIKTNFVWEFPVDTLAIIGETHNDLGGVENLHQFKSS
jgi:2'-5' RNA ligase